VGGGENAEDAGKPLILRKNDITIGLLAYAKKDDELNANTDRPGNNGFDVVKATRAINSIRKKVDILIVSIHWGWEFVNYPDPTIQQSFRQVIEAGADLILGHHPHFINGIEYYKGKPIFYSLGSFLIEYEPYLSEYELNLFRQSYGHNIAVEFLFNKKGIVSFKIYPVKMTEDRRVLFENEEERKETLYLMKKYSDPIQDKNVDKVFWKNSKNHLMIQFPAFKIGIRKNGLYAMESIFRWVTKPQIIKMLTGSFLKINLPNPIVQIISKLNLVIYKIFNLINNIPGRKKYKSIDIFDPNFQE
jgi:2',3'-cyclic-nucleotide 2'-phosphodiesterase (5'-nucleotidase family)